MKMPLFISAKEWEKILTKRLGVQKYFFPHHNSWTEVKRGVSWLHLKTVIWCCLPCRYHSRRRLRVLSLKQWVFCSPSQIVLGRGYFFLTLYLSTGPRGRPRSFSASCMTKFLIFEGCENLRERKSVLKCLFSFINELLISSCPKFCIPQF